MKIVRRADQVRTDRYPGVPRYPLVDSTMGSAGLHVGDLTYEPGSAVPHHRHPDAEETQIMLEGELECWLNGERFTVQAGDCIVAKRGVGHAFFNRSDTPARMITAFAISPPTTEHTDDPDLTDRRPAHNVVFQAWPLMGSDSTAARYPVNGPGGAAETSCELFVVPSGADAKVDCATAHETGLFVIDGTPTAASGSEHAAELGPGDFVLAGPEAVTVRNPGAHAATLLIVYRTRR